MKRLLVVIVAAFAALVVVSKATAEDYDSAAYATCSACHLPDGAGIPGAFPPIRDRAAAIASLEGGREFLIAVVSYGLMGTIEVGGTPYFGVMAGNTGAMSVDDLAAALNYIVFELGDADVEPFTVAEIEAVQAAIELKSPAGAGETRKALVEQHGDLWP